MKKDGDNQNDRRTREQEGSLRAISQISDQIDNRIFWLDGGTIALSAAFVQNQRSISGCVSYPYLLFFGWFLLLSAMVLLMVAYKLALRGNRKRYYATGIEEETNGLPSKQQKDEIEFQRKKADKIDNSVGIMNTIILITSCLGITIVMLNVCLNIL